MIQFNTHTLESAPAEAAEYLGAAKDAYSFVPNLLAVMAESPALLKGYMETSGAFDNSSLSATEQQIILLTNNRMNGCAYCMAAHTTISQMAGVSDSIISALRSGAPLSDPKLEALRIFAISINENRGWPKAGEVEAFLAAGYTRQSVLEVILGTAMKLMSNYTNHIAETPLDGAFSANAWDANMCHQK